MIDRRDLLATSAGLATLAASGFTTPLMAQEGLKLGTAQAFSFEALKTSARETAARPYDAPPRPKPDVLERIDYDAHGRIRYRPEMALWANGPSPWPVTFFHLGRYFQKPMRMHVVEGEAGKQAAREIVYDERTFDMPANSPARELPEGAGFAGFRFQESRSGQPGPKGPTLDWKGNDWVAFLGASYFRAIGDLFQYGLSARGLMLDAAVYGASEEFPDFTHVWLETPKPDARSVVVHALLSGPSVAGAYRFTMTREAGPGKAGVIMEVEKSLFLRKPVTRLGIAPLTSMYWYSETVKPTAVDWRPEVHDSDGLALWTGTGERIFRPLNNPPRTMTSSFGEENPRGFGLLQRDREFSHYLDGVYYDRRPGLWVEPLPGADGKGWGKGAVQLIEIPTDDEIHDNIVVAWAPAEPTRAGQALEFRYRLHWLGDEPFPTPLGRVVATRLGNGGQPGTVRPRNVRKFMVEFRGGPLANLAKGEIPEPVLWTSRGNFASYRHAEAVPNDVPGHWRTQFDLTVEGSEPVEMRCFLKAGDTVLTETWLYQYHPF